MTDATERAAEAVSKITAAGEITINLPALQLELRGDQIILFQANPLAGQLGERDGVSVTFSPQHAEEVADWLTLLGLSWKRRQKQLEETRAF